MANPMYKYITLCLIIAVLPWLAASQSRPYYLQTKFAGHSFFDGWRFFTGADPTHGFVKYVDNNMAVQSQLVSTTDDAVTIRADATNIASAAGRESVRIETIQTWNGGLFVMNLTHMPAGCGTWPAWWTNGASWPCKGENDIIEGVNSATTNLALLHAREECTMKSQDPDLFTGTWAIGRYGNNATDCWIAAPDQWWNQGCPINGPPGSFGVPFNENGGGIFAFEWTDAFIQTWFFPRGSAFPADLIRDHPNPARWGKPYAYWSLGPNCTPDHFRDHKMIINLTFCGDWAGGIFPYDPVCAPLGDCAAFVKNNPEAFAEAYWQINYVKVFQRHGS